MTFWSGLALQSLGCTEDAEALFARIFDYSVELERAEPKIDYFATSLPAMLLFEEDIHKRNRVEALFLRAQALMGLGRGTEPECLLREVLALDGNDADASDLLRQLVEVKGMDGVRPS